MTTPKQVEDGIRLCPISDPDHDFYDPEVHAEPVLCEIERDGDHEYWECPDEDCGRAFGHRMAEEVGGVRISVDSCEAGIPIAVRERAMGTGAHPLAGQRILPVLPS